VFPAAVSPRDAAWHVLRPHQSELLAAHLLNPLSDGLGPGRNAATTALRGPGLSGVPEPHGGDGRSAQACVSATAALMAARPAGLHLLLEVAAQASATSGVPGLPESITGLAATKRGSKLAEAARAWPW
jgi:hypothetical protein